MQGADKFVFFDPFPISKVYCKKQNKLEGCLKSSTPETDNLLLDNTVPPKTYQVLTMTVNISMSVPVLLTTHEEFLK